MFDQIRNSTNQFIHLIGQHPLVDRNRSETARVAIGQISLHQINQIGHVGPLQALEQVTSLIVVQVLLRQPLQGAVAECIQVGALREGPFRQGRPADPLTIQHRGIAGLRELCPTLMIKTQIQPPANTLQRFVRIFNAGQQGLAVQNLLQP